MTIRTLLFVPGDRPERFDKAAASGADAIVLDLEDAVPPASKVLARSAVQAWLRSNHYTQGPLRVVRVNAKGTTWFRDDVSMVRDASIHGVMLPKCEQPGDMDGLPDVGLWPMIENARGLANAQSIGARHGVLRLVFGGFDLQVDLGMESDADETELAPYRAQIVLASRLAGLAAPVDGVTLAFNDDVALTNATRRALRQGFGAKLCIHPRQVPVVHAAMHPSDEAIEHARRVLAAAAAAGGAAVAVDGVMVDRPVILRAQGVVARVERTGRD